ncbi:MAG: phosphotransferase family protein [Novosphingobium sp.]|nr:phosphotransferase family protein [Novosphingobium sp.]
MTVSTEPAPSTATIVAPNVRALDVLARDLAQWLRPRLPEADEVRVDNLAYPRGAGMSHETILFDAVVARGDGETRQGMVVRIKPTRHLVYQDDMFIEQYRLMQVMHDSGKVRVAKPLWLEETADLLGAPFFVMERHHGRVAVSLPPYCAEGWLFDAQPAQRRVLWEDSVRQLAAIQTVSIEQAAFLDPQEGPKGFDHEWDRWRRYLAWMKTSRDLPFHDRAFAQLEATMPADRTPGIVWGDARLGNMMVGDDFKVAVVMDWEQTSLGGPLHDLGWWLFTERMQTVGRGLAPLDGMGSRDETLALWREVSGKSTADIAWHEAFAGFKMACLHVHMIDLGGAIARGRGPHDNPTTRAVADLLGIDAPQA